MSQKEHNTSKIGLSVIHFKTPFYLFINKAKEKIPKSLNFKHKIILSIIKNKSSHFIVKLGLWITAILKWIVKIKKELWKRWVCAESEIIQSDIRKMFAVIFSCS